MRDDPSVVVLVTHAAGNDQQARDELVERYAPLAWTRLFRDPPCSNYEISARLGIPIGSIGPQRARVLERLRQSPAVTTFGESKFSASSPGGGHGA
jgi:hypothetical protein